MFTGLLSVCTAENLDRSLSSNPLKSITSLSLINQTCKPHDQHLLILTLMKLFFIQLLLVLISILEVLTLSVIHMLKFEFQIK